MTDDPRPKTKDEALANWREHVGWRGGVPQTWKFRADELWAGAKVLSDRQRWGLDQVAKFTRDGSVGVSPEGIEASLYLQRPAQLLAGLALEALLKGILIAQDPKRLERAGRFYTHDLTTLATTAGVAIDAREEELLETLTELVVWAGRYPVPVWHNPAKRTRADATITEMPDGTFAITKAYVFGVLGTGVWADLEALWQRFEAELGAAMTDAPTPPPGGLGG